jgi:hypothetical protein
VFKRALKLRKPGHCKGSGLRSLNSSDALRGLLSLMPGNGSEGGVQNGFTVFAFEAEVQLPRKLLGDMKTHHK